MDVDATGMRLLLGVTGGIAAYKGLETARLAVKAGHAVRVVQTPEAQRFVGAASFAAITGAPVLTSEFERDPARGVFPGQATPAHDPASHLALVENADVFLVAPATANTIAKLAHGLADNLLTSAALAARCPLVVAPAMNDAMWEHPATQANLATLRARGVTIVDPGVGALGTLGEWGAGRLAEPPALLAAAERAATARATATGPWDGLRVLVTAGGTREPIDAVRFVGNRSSGRMGFAVASAAAALGADVTVLAANVALGRDPRVTYVDVSSAADLEAACAEHFPGCHVLVMSAAVADFRPVDPAEVKLKKTGRDELTITMEPTPDILTGLAAGRRPGQTLVGFAAETGEGAVAYGRDKLVRKRLDAVVVNDVAQAGIGFDTPDNEVTIVTAAGEEHVARRGKDEVAAAILRTVDALRSASATPLGR
ncbi:bifunctional phosphopantothenoylcysteine decarboxylase/phosphopantothenate--cysteine ligase CoaBC [Paraconexibacter antarcticus]|uniref:Coenzyme A biosynthesis bifunctional protein CoaBC n=1 Tax=Paraconexibacter antarcticus TaxID=2949664 RepID=A0ABY5DPP7_9ACTN|nr:bifunctional phosphopantothenoylcysteine decarboxylase/phosphopantothenate--cysteine ligase CoaBC [Paraconexibacter antarcticus]UTI62747.1 bifunctional phosphopantothenoylcysteine decarboxylase/phosphopantothenate--cysteine ligase CoaBC [Paraconexibacter antarcticus]